MDKYLKGIGLLILSGITFLAIATPWVPILDDVNLIFHEAGHVLFSLFGEIIYLAGGSIFQILLPLFLIIPFTRKGEIFSAILMFWWAGENMISVGRYIADARAQQLELLGGEHDWAVILAHWPHIMRYDTLIGETVRNIGIAVMLIALCLGAWIILRGNKRTAPDLLTSPTERSIGKFE